jgi:hypothetical protein
MDSKLLDDDQKMVWSSSNNWVNGQLKVTKIGLITIKHMVTKILATN